MRWRYIILGLILMAFCIALIVFPIISNIAYSRASEQAYLEFAEVVSDTDSETRLAALDAARAYNAGLLNGVYEGFTPTTVEQAKKMYDTMLSIDDSDVMGYLSIPAIDVNLPIRHGTEESLDTGLGHLIGTSLPVGGPSTHSVITGHSGVPTNKLLTDLDRVVIGDRFSLTVMGEQLSYQVIQIDVVEPWDTELLRIEPGRDLVTLITCTPYGINSHRLLVRGERIADVEVSDTQEPTAPAGPEHRGSTWESEYVKGILLGLGSGAVLICIFAVISRRKRHA